MDARAVKRLASRRTWERTARKYPPLSCATSTRATRFPAPTWTMHSLATPDPYWPGVLAGAAPAHRLIPSMG
jgi:hypothetical protein